MIFLVSLRLSVAWGSAPDALPFRRTDVHRDRCSTRAALLRGAGTPESTRRWWPLLVRFFLSSANSGLVPAGSLFFLVSRGGRVEQELLCDPQRLLDRKQCSFE